MRWPCIIGCIGLAVPGLAGWMLTSWGCGLGYIEIVPQELLSVRIDNAASEFADFKITVSPLGGSEAGADTGGEVQPSSPVTDLLSDTVIRVEGHSVSSGIVLCGEMVTISATSGRSAT